MRQYAIGKWAVGLNIVPSLPRDAFDHLFTSKMIDRRRSPRRCVCRQAVGQWQLDAARFPVELTDFSATGFCLSGPISAMQGRRMALHMECAETGKSTIRGKVQWSMKTADGHLVGCTFIDDDGYARMKSETIPNCGTDRSSSNA